MADDSEEPIIDLPQKQKELEDLILNSPDSAWEALQKDPAMVLALTQVKRNLEEDERENVVEFFEEYHKYVNQIFIYENPLDRFGIALATEFLTDYWRKAVATTQLTSINKAISEKMALFKEASDLLPDSYEKSVTSKIVEYSSQRVHEFTGYNKEKAKDHLFEVRPAIDDMIKDMLEDGITQEILSLSYFATSAVESIEILRDYMAKSLMLQIKAKFDDFDEESKYKIAPYLGVFDKITNKESEE